MGRGRRTARSGNGPSGEELARVLEVEQRLAAELAAAEAEARRLVEDATARAADDERAFARRLEAALEAVRSEEAQARARRLAAAQAESDRAARPYRAVDDTRVRALAGLALDLLVAGDGPAPGEPPP